MALPVEYKVNLVRPLVETTGPVDAIAVVLYRGRSVSTAECKLVDGAGKLYAHASVTCTILTPEVKPEEKKED
jgi:acyl-coenzyme A thioesterase PaaI-like protein